MPGIVTARTRRLYQRPPAGPFVLNRDSLQARGLVAWWPLNVPNSRAQYDLVTNGRLLTQTGTMGIAAGPNGGYAASNTGSTSNFFTIGSAVVSALPLSFSCWFNVASAVTGNNLVSISASGSANWYLLAVGGDVPGAVLADVFGSGVENFSQTSTLYTANTWNHGAAVFTTTTSRTSYLNGGGAGTDTTARTVGGTLNRTDLGVERDNVGNLFSPLNGAISDARIYNLALTAGEVAAQSDPRSRWDLYYQLAKRTYSFRAPAGTIVTPGTATLALTAFAPVVSVSDNKLATPGVVSLTTARFAPVIGLAVIPPTAALTVTAFAPVIGLAVIPPVAMLALTAFAPAAVIGTVVTPGVAALTLTGFAPAVLLPALATPGTATLTTAAFAPVVTATANVTATPDTAALVITSYAPAALTPVTVTPGVAALAITAFAPSVVLPVTATPDAAALSLTAFAPAVAATANVTITPDPAALTLTGFAPDVSGPVAVTPDPAVLTLTGFAPEVTGDPPVVPVIIGGGGSAYGSLVPPRPRKPRVVRPPVVEVEDESELELLACLAETL